MGEFEGARQRGRETATRQVKRDEQSRRYREWISSRKPRTRRSTLRNYRLSSRKRRNEAQTATLSCRATNHGRLTHFRECPVHANESSYTHTPRCQVRT
jgi:hypothetical protein